MKKFLSLMMLLLIAGGGKSWADTEVSPVGGTSNADVYGKSFSINGTTNAGSGTKINPMSDKGIKVRKATPLVMTVNEGYRINSVTVYAASNDNTKTFQISKIEVDGTEYVPTGKTMPITCAQKNASNATTIEITEIAAKENITFTFDGTHSQGIMEFHVDYTQEEVIVQEITAVTLNGTAISAENLATLKTDKALTLDGSELNGVGMVDVTLSSGGTTVTKSIDGTTATYNFTINGTDAYTVTVNNLSGTYTEQGAVVYYSKNDEKVEGGDTKTVTANGITFTMVDESKNFQYGVGSVTMGDNKYVPLKLSTGSAVNVTFPEGKVATKAIVYGWSMSGNGKLTAFKETADAEEKVVDVSADVFYATNQASDTYPSVYEYTLDNWESLYFTAGGSASQPFVVIDFVLADKPAAAGTELANIAALKNFSTDIMSGVYGDDAVLTLTNAKVTFVTTMESLDYDDDWNPITVLKDYVLIEDESAGYLLEGSGLGKFVKAGDVLNGKLAMYLVDNYGWGIYQATLTNGIEGVTITSGEVSPIVVTADIADDYSADNDCRLAQFTDAAITGTDSGYGIELSFTTSAIEDAISMQDQYGVLTESVVGATGTLTGYMMTLYGNTFFVPTAFEAAAATETVEVTVTNVGYATFSSDKNLDFTNAEKIKAYTAKFTSDDVVEFTRIYQVPANTGVLLWATGGATEYIPVIASADAVSGNAFKVAQTDMNKGDLDEAGTTYVLGNHNDYGIGFYRPGEDCTLPAGKCYLQVSGGDARIFLPGMEATGIGATLVKNEGVKNEIFNLNGQRINKLQKGLNIVNGKKVIVK